MNFTRITDEQIGNIVVIQIIRLGKVRLDCNIIYFLNFKKFAFQLNT